jgi:hypothetical protein
MIVIHINHMQILLAKTIFEKFQSGATRTQYL